MSNILMVPIHLDALFIKNDKLVVEPMADFTRLPYFKGERDVNPNVANISEEVVSQPFQDKNFHLKTGIHLHWALPDALTKTIGIPSLGTGFPAVPNCWLIERKGGGLPTQTWVVESDYLYAYEPFRKGEVGSVNILFSAELFSGGNPEAIAKLTHALKKSTSISKFIKQKLSSPTQDLLKRYSSGTPSEELQVALIWELNQILQGSSLYDKKLFSQIELSPETQQLLDSNPQGENLVRLNRLLLEAAYPECKAIGHQPFRYLGRKMTLEDWLKQRDQTVPYVERFNPLTAIGYGEPTFAAFYPNCHSVFGFYDGDIRSLPNPDKKLQYTIVGWYERGERDYFKMFINHARKIYQDNNTDLLTAIQTEFKWTADIPESQEFPEQMLCYARLTFDPASDTDNADKASSITKIAIGNTGTEALAAYLSHEFISDKESSLEDSSRHRALIEDQLEALHLLANLEHRQVDIGSKFEEARHEKGFNAVPAGILWTIRYETETDKANAADVQTGEGVTLPKEIADSLNELNLKQQEYDRALDEIESLRHRLFSDWYKYMLCAYPPDDSRDDYPDIDEVKHYIEVKGIAPLNQKLKTTGELKLIVDERKVIVKAEAFLSNSIASELADKVNNLLAQINILNKRELERSNPSQNGYVLQQVPAPRYWQPNEPVILIAGEAAKYTQRHGSDGRLRNDNLLECQLYDNSENKQLSDLIVAYERTIALKIDEIVDEIEKTSKDSIAFSTWKQQPWNPSLLEWEVEVLPVKHQNNLHPETRDYDPNFILSNYTLEENATDLSVKTGEVLPAANIYSGSCIVTPHASMKLNRELTAYLEKSVEPTLLKEFYGGQNKFLAKFSEKEDISRFISWCLPKLNLRDETSLQQNATNFVSWIKADMPAGILEQFYKDPNITKDNQNDTYLQQNISQFVHWCQVELPKLYQLVVLGSAYEKLSKLNCFSQVLGGFNVGLLMHKQTMQLRIDEPIGFEDYKAFTERVRQTVGDRAKVAPLPFNDFNPIRTGVMRILRLRLIDTFGQVKDLDPQNLIVTEKMLPPSNYTLPNTTDWVFLPPRLVQPSRLNFRWLSAERGEQESNSHPVTTPICGWLLPNNLDNSLMVYDGAGNALGSVNQQAEWNPAPGTDVQVQFEEIANLYLRKIVERLTVQANDTVEIRQRKQSFIDSFISAIDKALENIEPENFAQHQDLALLMGNPIAVVRASLNLELQGLPAIHHGWNEFRQDLQREERDTDEVTRVKFPMRTKYGTK